MTLRRKRELSNTTHEVLSRFCSPHGPQIRTPSGQRLGVGRDRHNALYFPKKGTQNPGAPVARSLVRDWDGAQSAMRRFSVSFEAVVEYGGLAQGLGGWLC